MNWPLKDLFEVYPSRGVFERPDELINLELPDGWRGGGLLPAVHDAAVVDLSTILVGGLGGVLPAAGGYAGEAFLHDGATAIRVASGLQRRGVDLLSGEWVASDGARWYRVTPYNRQAAVVTAVDVASDVWTGIGANLADGNRVQLTTTGTLPGGYAVVTDLYVVERADAGWKLAATAGGVAIDATSVGTGVHSVLLMDEPSYYPTDFERELFKIEVTDGQLVVKSSFQLQLGLEMMLVAPLRDRRVRESAVQWSFVLEIGTFDQDVALTGAGANFSGETWMANPVLEQRVMVTTTPVVHTFGLEVLRELVNGQDTVRLEAWLYGLAGASIPPLGANFSVRGRLIRFDTDDGVSDPRGAVAVLGFDRFSGGGTPPEPLGLGRIV